MVQREKLNNIPTNPGVYLMKDVYENIIYVGKAKNLRNRVRQYFNDSNKTIKVVTMIENIDDFEVIVTDTEMEALILECNLIKKHMPRFNIMLKDDKSYPYIKVSTNESYPRVIMTRKVKRDGSEYFGPFTNSSFVRQTVDLINKMYELKRCNKSFDGKKEVRPCLNYHIKQCSGVCIGKVSEDEYRKRIDEVLDILNEKQDSILDRLKDEMKTASKNLDFEKAADIRDQIQGIVHITEKQKVVSKYTYNQDVIGFYNEDTSYCVQVFFIRGGKLSGRKDFYFTDIEDEKHFMTQFIKQFYSNFVYIPKEVLIQIDIDDMEIIEQWLSEKKGNKVSIKVPQRGDKKKLLNMVIENAEIALFEKIRSVNRKNERDEMIYNWLMINLELSEKPTRIEAFDISNIKGVDSVGSMVVCEHLSLNKKAYRRFRIKSIVGQNDYGSMQEVVFRRLERGIKELVEGKSTKFLPFPQIIFLDGGLGHVNSVKQILNHYPQLDIKLCGLVKDDKHRLREVIYEGKSIEIPSSTPVYYLLNSISEEVHRFAISYHTKLRSNSLFESELNNIPGIGKVKRNALLKHFKSLDNIKKASSSELLQVDGISDKIANNIIEYFKDYSDDHQEEKNEL